MEWRECKLLSVADNDDGQHEEAYEEAQYQPYDHCYEQS